MTPIRECSLADPNALSKKDQIFGQRTTTETVIVDPADKLLEGVHVEFHLSHRSHQDCDMRRGKFSNQTFQERSSFAAQLLTGEVD